MIAINFTLIVQLAIVLGLMVVLGQVIFKPFLAILQERKDRDRGRKKSPEPSTTNRRIDQAIPGRNICGPNPGSNDSRKDSQGEFDARDRRA